MATFMGAVAEFPEGDGRGTLGRTRAMLLHAALQVKPAGGPGGYVGGYFLEATRLKFLRRCLGKTGTALAEGDWVVLACGAFALRSGYVPRDGSRGGRQSNRELLMDPRA